MLNRTDIETIVDRIDYKPGWCVRTGRMGDGFYVQWVFDALDEAGDLEPQTGRKWYVSSHATRSEVVQTLLKAVLTAEEHEAREQFRYDGVAIFGPHLDVDAMVAAPVGEARRTA